jgi:predicted nucleic acid-binding protein
VIVVDSSAWVEYLRKTGSAVHRRLRGLIEDSAHLAVTEIVVMEVLAGARDRRHARELRSRLLAFDLLLLRGVDSFDAAADLYRACWDAGETVRELADCLIAVPTIEAGATLLHADRDFELIARHTPLRLEPVA